MLELLRGTVLESLRLWATTPMILRETTAEVEFEHGVMPAGTVASILTDENNGEDWFGVGTSDETLTRLQDEIAQATDVDTRAAALEELQAYVLEQAYFVPRTQMVQRIYAQSPDVSGVTYNALAYALAVDALTHDGPGQLSRIDVRAECAKFATDGLSLADIFATEALIPIAGAAILAYPNKVTTEPPIMAYAQNN